MKYVDKGIKIKTNITIINLCCFINISNLINVSKLKGKNNPLKYSLDHPKGKAVRISVVVIQTINHCWSLLILGLIIKPIINKGMIKP